jgi:hypothetical protein
VPKSDTLPTLVYPDEPRARAAVRKEVRPDMWADIEFCRDFSPDHYARDRCYNASPDGERAHNWCFRCPCGFMFIRLDEKDMNLSRDRALTTAGH